MKCIEIIQKNHSHQTGYPALFEKTKKLAQKTKDNIRSLKDLDDAFQTCFGDASESEVKLANTVSSGALKHG